jgi:hypothetical protein
MHTKFIKLRHLKYFLAQAKELNPIIIPQNITLLDIKIKKL